MSSFSCEVNLSKKGLQVNLLDPNVPDLLDFMYVEKDYKTSGKYSLDHFLSLMVLLMASLAISWI